VLPLILGHELEHWCTHQHHSPGVVDRHCLIADAAVS
jgi:hypothetical protein